MQDFQNASQIGADKLGAAKARRDMAAASHFGRPFSDPLRAYLRGYRFAAQGWFFQSRTRLNRLPHPSIQLIALPPALGRLAASALAIFSLLLGGILFAGTVALTVYWSLYADEIDAMVIMAQERANCARITALRAADGPIMASIPAAACERRTTQSVPMPTDLTLEIAESFGVIEGRWRKTQTWAGHDLSGIPRYLYGMLTGQRRGFSAPLLTAFEYVVDKPGSLGWREKLLTIRAASLFVNRQLRSDEDRARFIVDNIGAVIGRGTPLAGELGAQAIFGRLPETLLERCVFARAMGVQLFLPRRGEEITPRIAENWAAVVGPGAARCIRLRADTVEEAARNHDDINEVTG